MENSGYTLIAGLGNIGEKFHHTRHNLGFNLVDFIANQLDLLDYQHRIKETDTYWALVIPEIKIILTKPKTMMNLSGKAIRQLKSEYGINNTDIYIAYDDLDISLGKFKIQYSKSPKKHNGVESIIKEGIGKDFNHIRIGSDNRISRLIPGIKYVLSKLTTEERNQVEQIFPEILLELIARINLKLPGFSVPKRLPLAA
ncbi:MAG: aminoacyl-tRNA hydrolase [Candidatus Dojkabacteria bacterium]|nr:MAG: aminoacyl-tRNA hydrolase [Candidatus Dojkabacteria bacterium]